MTKISKVLFINLFLSLCLLNIIVEPVDASLYVSSEYYCLIDRESGQIILSRNAGKIRQIASTTKVMTAILATEYANLDEIAIVSKKADRVPEFTIGLREGQEISVKELIKVALIKSSNDAAVVLAEHVTGDEEFFAYLMSKKAFLIGASNSFFKNASGLPDPAHNSTAFDLAQIGRYALNKPYIKEIVAKKESQFSHPGYTQPLTIRNTNRLLANYSGADGIKTGTTNHAGKCLIASATRGEKSFIAVVLKSGDRTGDCARLLDYGFDKSYYQKVVDNSKAFKSLRIQNGNKNYLDIYPAEDLYLLLGDDELDIEKKITLNYMLEAPIKSKETIGNLDIYLNDTFIRSIKLISKENLEKESGFLQKSFLELVNLMKGIYQQGQE